MKNKEEYQTQALTFLKIDSSFDTDKLLQRIKEILNEGQSHNAGHFNTENWQWQYRQLPTRDSHIYVCLLNNEVFGYYHAAVYEGCIDGSPKKFAMVQDVAVSKTLRGQGVFRQLAEFATADLLQSDVNLIYTFPNKKSIHTFLKYNNYKVVSTYDAYLLPVKSKAIINSKLKLSILSAIAGFLADAFINMQMLKLKRYMKVKQHDLFDDEITEAFRKFNSQYIVSLNRNKNYLQWRFQLKPGSKHFIFSTTENNRIAAVAIFKVDTMLAVNTAIMLDFAFETELQLIRLLHEIRRKSEFFFHTPVAMIFTAFNCNNLLQKKKYGFIKVPERFNPRPLQLLINKKVENIITTEKQNWFAALSDWDVL